MGVLVRRGLLSSDLVFDIMYASLEAFYERFESIFNEMRVIYNEPLFARDLEYVYNEMKKLHEESICE